MGRGGGEIDRQTDRDRDRDREKQRENVDVFAKQKTREGRGQVKESTDYMYQVVRITKKLNIFK